MSTRIRTIYGAPDTVGETVPTFADRALRLWRDGDGTHHPGHNCFLCADGRAGIGAPPLNMIVAGRTFLPLAPQNTAVAVPYRLVETPAPVLAAPLPMPTSGRPGFTTTYPPQHPPRPVIDGLEHCQRCGAQIATNGHCLECRQRVRRRRRAGVL